MARDPGRRADLVASDAGWGLPLLVDEQAIRAASAAVSLRRRNGGGAPGLRFGAPRGPAVNSSQGGSWLRPDPNCDRAARPYWQRKHPPGSLKNAQGRFGLRPAPVLSERNPPRPTCAAALAGLSDSDLQLRRSRVVWGSIGAAAVASGGVSPPDACFGGGRRLRARPGGPTGRRFASGSGSIWYASPREDRAR
jgi:hypothetical protein